MTLLCCMKGSCRIKKFWKFILFTKTVRSGIRTTAYKCKLCEKNKILEWPCYVV